MNGFALGVHDLRRGLAFLRAHPRLWRWVLAPALVTLALLVGAVVGVAMIATRAVGVIEAHLPTVIAGFVGTLLMILVTLVLAVGALLIAVTVAGIIAGPFCERLSEVVEELHTGRATPGAGGLHFVRELVRGAAHSIRRLASALVGALVLLALSVVPVIGHVAALLLGGYFAARASAYDCYDALLARRQLPYDAKLAILRARRARSLGLGAAVSGLWLVPIVNLLALGLGTIGATLALLDDPPA